MNHALTAEKILDWATARGLAHNARFRDATLRLSSIVSNPRTKKLPGLLGSSAKTVKGEKKQILTGIMYLAPADESGVNVCPFASAGCRAACLGHDSGRMRMPANKVARILRTWWYFADRESFREALRFEIAALWNKAQRREMAPFVRLNGTSDIHPSAILGAKWWGYWQTKVTFYDYTKDRDRAEAEARNPYYSLTFSRSEATEHIAIQALCRNGVNVAVVFAERLPKTYLSIPVIDGDETDARPTDDAGVIVGLTTKGPKARNDASGFVVRSHLEYA